MSVAQDMPRTAGLSLRQAFEAAWARQPEAAALEARREAAQAERRAAQAFTPEPPALEVLARTDQVTRDRGVREQEVGISLPLWLPGEKARSGALAEAESRVVETQLQAARLRLAGAVREAYWEWVRARLEVDRATDQVNNARRLAVDVAARFKAGDLARSDQHLADGAVAAAEAGRAQATAAALRAEQEIRALIGAQGLASRLAPLPAPSPVPEPEPPAGLENDKAVRDHPAVEDLLTRAEAADRAAALAVVRSRANPDLTLIGGRARDGFGEPFGQSVTLAMRIPFGGTDRYRARVARARADATELQVQAALETQRVAVAQSAAGQRIESARLQVAAAERRALLANESRAFFDRSFRLGETDLPGRLRVEAEAVEAQRQAALSRLELAAIISERRQALGLLPE
ncbi:MAG: TolC family protein [Burkholderiales bacterium]|nr:TolC family protein [Burkholderiales bacterium]